jgi:hypothetical protein
LARQGSTGALPSSLRVAKLLLVIRHSIFVIFPARASLLQITLSSRDFWPGEILSLPTFSCRNWATHFARVNLATSFAVAAVETRGAYRAELAKSNQSEGPSLAPDLRPQVPAQVRTGRPNDPCRIMLRGRKQPEGPSLTPDLRPLLPLRSSSVSARRPPLFFQSRLTTKNTKLTKEINSYANHQSTIFDHRF